MPNGTCTAAAGSVCQSLGGDFRELGSSCSALTCARPICSEYRRIRLGCVRGGAVNAIAILDNDLHNGQEVAIRVNGVVHHPTVINRIATQVICCPTGLITLELLDPEGCLTPVTMTCTP